MENKQVADEIYLMIENQLSPDTLIGFLHYCVLEKTGVIDEIIEDITKNGN